MQAILQGWKQHPWLAQAVPRSGGSSHAGENRRDAQPVFIQPSLQNASCNEAFSWSVILDKPESKGFQRLIRILPLQATWNQCIWTDRTLWQETTQTTLKGYLDLRRTRNTSTPQLHPLRDLCQIPSNRDHRALKKTTLGGCWSWPTQPIVSGEGLLSSLFWRSRSHASTNVISQKCPNPPRPSNRSGLEPWSTSMGRLSSHPNRCISVYQHPPTYLY